MNIYDQKWNILKKKKEMHDHRDEAESLLTEHEQNMKKA